MESMSKKKDQDSDSKETTPDEIKKLVGEFIKRLTNVENEMETLKEDRKELIEEFKQKLDMKELQAAIKLVKLEANVVHRDTFDLFVEVLKDDKTNGLVD